MTSTARAASVLAIIVAAVGCGQTDPSSSSSEPTPTDTSAAATSDGSVKSVDQVTDGFWQPVQADGADVDLTEGDYWQFLTRDGQLLVIGFDGCNGFGSSSSRDGAPTALQDGRLVNLGVASQAMACDGVEYGPYPEEGDLLTLTTDGSRLDVSDASGTRIELIRLDETPVRRLGETPTSGASDTAAPITDPPQRDEPFWAVPTEIVETTVPCSGERVSDSFDYVEGHRGAATIEDAVDGWNFDGGATYRGAELFAVVDADAGRAALVDGDGNLRVLLTVRENENGWLVESSERCLDP